MNCIFPDKSFVFIWHLDSRDLGTVFILRCDHSNSKWHSSLKFRSCRHEVGWRNLGAAYDTGLFYSTSETCCLCLWPTKSFLMEWTGYDFFKILNIMLWIQVFWSEPFSPGQDLGKALNYWLVLRMMVNTSLICLTHKTRFVKLLVPCPHSDLE